MKSMPCLVITMCLTLALPSGAHAQAVARSFPDARTTLKPGQTVVVTQINGQTLRGTLTELTASEIRFEMWGAPQRVGREAVQSIAVIDHRVTAMGPLIGGAAGLGAGLLFVELGRDCGGCGVNGANGYRIGFAAIGIVVGAAIESARGHERLLYWAPSKAVSIAPILGPSRKGLEIRIRF